MFCWKDLNERLDLIISQFVWIKPMLKCIVFCDNATNHGNACFVSRVRLFVHRISNDTILTNRDKYRPSHVIFIFFYSDTQVLLGCFTWDV